MCPEVSNLKQSTISSLTHYKPSVEKVLDRERSNAFPFTTHSNEFKSMSQAHRFLELTNTDLIMDYIEHSLPNLPQSPEPERALARADQNSLQSGCCNSPSQRCNELPITFAFLRRQQARAQSRGSSANPGWNLEPPRRRRRRRGACELLRLIALGNRGVTKRIKSAL